MGGYAIRVNRFLSLTLSLMISVTSPLLSFRYALWFYASGPTLSSALSHLACPLCFALPFDWLVAGDGQHMARSWDRACPVESTEPLMRRRRCP